MARLDMRMPLRFLRGSVAGCALSVIALAAGVALVCAMGLANRAVLHAFIEVVDTTAGRAALEVRAGEDGLLAEDTTALVAAVPGVALAVPVVSATAFVPEDDERLVVQGIDIANDDAVRVYDTRGADGLETDDPLVFLAQPDSVALTRAFAARHGLAIGDRLVLETPAGRRSFTVRGLLEPTGVARAYGGNLVVMDLLAAEAVFTRPGFVNRVDVVLAPETDVAATAERIAARLPPGLRVEAPEQRKVDLGKVIQSVRLLLQAAGLVVLVAAFLIAFNRLATVFEQRAWQLGVLHAIGVREAVVRHELVKEGLVLGVAGVALGLPGGVALGRALLPVIASTTSLAGNVVMPATEMAVRPASLALAALLGVVAALLAAMLPARRAARLGIAATIRGRGTEAVDVRTPWRWRVALLAAVAGAVGAQWLTRSPLWGLVATALAAVATALLARPLVALVAMVVPALAWLGAPGGRLAVETIVRSPRRAALTTATLGVGVGAVVWLWTVAGSFEQSVVEALSAKYRVADVAVLSVHRAVGFLEAPLEEGLVDEIRRIPGVAVVVGELLRDWHHGGGPITVDALDASYFGDPALPRCRLVGAALPDVWDAVVAGRAVLVSGNFAMNLGVRTGDRMTLDTPGGPLAVVVGGTIIDFASPRGTLLLGREVYARLWQDRQVNHVLVRLAPGSDAETVQAAIGRLVKGRYDVEILLAGPYIDHFAADVRRGFAPVGVLAGLVLLVVLVGIADTLAAGIGERTRHLGTLRAIGVRRGRLARTVVLEGLLLAGLGLVLALAAGLALGTLWVETTFPYLLGWVLELHLPWARVAVVGTVTLATATLAALLPARRVARLAPAVALREE